MMHPVRWLRAWLSLSPPECVMIATPEDRLLDPDMITDTDALDVKWARARIAMRARRDHAIEVFGPLP